MSLAAQLSADAPAFLADFGEAVIYTAQGQAPKSLTAVIERMPLRQDSLGGRPVPVNAIELWLPNHATTGVLSVKEGFDTVALKRKLSDAQDTLMRITKVVGDSDAGMWHLEATA